MWWRWPGHRGKKTSAEYRVLRKDSEEATVQTMDGGFLIGGDGRDSNDLPALQVEQVKKGCLDPMYEAAV